jgi:hypothetical protein
MIDTENQMSRDLLFASKPDRNKRLNKKKAGLLKIKRSHELLVDYKTGAGLFTKPEIAVKNSTGETIWVRLYKVNTRAATKFVTGIIGPDSQIVEIENGGTAPVQYEGVSGFERINPSINIHLYWSTMKADLEGNQPYGNKPSKWNTDMKMVRYTDHNFDITTITPPPPAPAPKKGGKKGGKIRKTGGNKSVPRW